MQGPAYNTAPSESPRRLIGRDQVLRLYPVSKSTLERHIKRGLFPKQAQKPQGTTSAMWFEDEVIACLEARRNTPATKSKTLSNNVPTKSSILNSQLSMSKQVSPKEPTSTTRQKAKPYLMKSPSRSDGSEFCMVVRQVTICSKTLYYEPSSGNLFELVGQL
jgi:predicted DNA-binding transcriptional regulator AlpA